MTPTLNTMAFVYLARNAGPTFDDLAFDIRALTRGGDRVVIIDDGSTDDTPGRIGRFGEMVGWGTDVAVNSIITGTAVTADLGIALNLALETLATPGIIPERVTVFTAGSRIDAGILTAARTRAETENLDLLVFPLWQWSLDLGRMVNPPGHDQWPAVPGEDARAHALRMPPAVNRMIMRWSVLAAPPALRAEEDHDSHSDLALVWTATLRAKRIGVTTKPAGHGPQPPVPGWSTLIAAGELIRKHPAATDWIISHLPSLLVGISPATAATIIEGLTTASASSGTETGLLTDLITTLPDGLKNHIIGFLRKQAPDDMILNGSP